MNTANVVRLMKQQQGAITEIEELLAFDAKQTDNPHHTINLDDIKALKTYVSTMKTACTTAIALATYYTVTPAAKQAAVTKSKAEIDEQNGDGAEQQPEAPKPRSRAKKAEPVKEEPPVEDDDDLDFLN